MFGNRVTSRRLRWAAWILPLAVVASRGRAEIRATLAPASEQAATLLPFRLAELTVEAGDRDPAEAIEAVSLRELRGGPTFVYPLALPPGGRQTLSVALPPVSQEQAYRVTFLGKGRRPSGVVAETTASIRWGEDQLTDLEFVAPGAYAPWLEDLPLWPGELRRNVLVALALTGLAAAAATLIRRRGLRAAAVMLVAAAAAGASCVLLANAPIVVQRTSEDPSFLVLQSRRTTVWRSDRTDLVPLYYDLRHMREDEMVVRAGRDIRVPLSPRVPAQRVRVFRRRKLD